jgi:hypothetical protein
VKLARYWTREAGEATGRDGRRLRVVARGWSNESVEAARAVARDIGRRVAERLLAGRAEGRHYAYGERPLPEPVVREFPGGGGELAAVVTRNAYGALVLNARDLVFVDIDRDDGAAPAAGGGLVAGVLSLFGKAPAPPPAAASGVLADIERVAARQGLAARVYRTAAGYRAIVTSTRLPAGPGPGEALLQAFGADPLYVRLCRLQESFRARLTPKPWRCGLRLPPAAFPFETPQAQSQARTWEAEYAAASARYATCRYVATVGGGTMAPGLEELIRYHDQETRATAELPLA